MAHPRAPDRPRHRAACPTSCSSIAARSGGTQLVQTYDAGVTVDQWATLLPVARDGAVRRHVFEDCAHWWALAHHCLARARRDPRAASSCTSTSRATTSAFRTGRRTSIRDAPGLRALSGVRAARADRLRVLAGVAREPHHAAADRLAEGLRLPVAAPAAARSRPAAAAISQPDARARLALRHLQPRGDAQALPAGRRHGRMPRAARPGGPRSATTTRRALIFTASRQPRPRAAAAGVRIAQLIDVTGARLREDAISRGRSLIAAGRSRATQGRRRRVAIADHADHADDADCAVRASRRDHAADSNRAAQAGYRDHADDTHRAARDGRRSCSHRHAHRGADRGHHRCSGTRARHGAACVQRKRWSRRSRRSPRLPRHHSSVTRNIRSSIARARRSLPCVP